MFNLNNYIKISEYFAIFKSWMDVKKIGLAFNIPHGEFVQLILFKDIMKRSQ